MKAAVALASAFAAAHPERVARLADQGDPADLAPILEELAPAAAARVLSACTPRRAAAALVALGDDSLRRLHSAVGPQRLAWMLLSLPEAERDVVSRRLPEPDRRAIEQLIRYGSDVAGGVAEPRVASVHQAATVAQALDTLQGDAAAAHYYVYVTGDAQRLVGVASLRALLLADRSSKVTEVMARRPACITAGASLTAVASHPGWARFPALPVVTSSGQLVGVIRYARYREIVEALSQSATAPGHDVRTVSALAEVYAVGTSAFVHWVGTALSRESDDVD